MTVRADAVIPHDVEDFLTDRLATVLELDVLLLLAGAGRIVTAADAGRHLRVEASVAALLLQRLERSCLAGRAGTGYVLSADHRTRRLIEQIADLNEQYRRRLVRYVILSARRSA